MDIGGAAACLCLPGFTGDGITCSACTTCDSTEFATSLCNPIDDTTCTACTVCDITEFASTPCSPFADAVCTTCAPACGEGTFESQPCTELTDRVCSSCTFCNVGEYVVAPCTPTANAICAPCEPGCLSCGGPGPTCFMCDPLLVLDQGTCVQPMCGNLSIEPGEQCDDGDTDPGDGCDSNCMVEADSYCFGELFSTCRAGSCITEPATALPLGAGFSLDGAGTASPAGLQLTQRSMIRTTAPVAYPVVIEATVVYNGFDVTYAGTRGNGLRDDTAGDEPTDSLRARLAVPNTELATGPGTTVIAATQTPFSPFPGVPYRVRFVDDGLIATVEWFNPNDPNEFVVLQQMSSYHGSDDRAFVGGGDQGNVTFSDIRVCSAPALPVTSGLVAHYSAIPSWTVTQDGFGMVSAWADQSGNGRTLTSPGGGPIFQPGAINLDRPAVDFNGGMQLSTAAFPLTTDVSVFAVIHHRTPAQWGAIAHHGSRDLDWSMEQSGGGNPDELHWQTNNDNTNMNLTLVSDTSYVMTGVFDGLDRYFSATTFDASTIAPVSITDLSHSISTGSKVLYLGSSDNNEASNAAIGELVYFNRALSTVERDAVIAYLRALWRPHAFGAP